MADKLVLEAEVKSNIKTATKDTQDWNKTLETTNEQLDIQRKVLTDLEKQLLQLKAKQDAIPKGSWYAGRGELNKQIQQTEAALKLEKLGLKELTNQQKEANRKVKEFNKLNKEQKDIGEDTIMNFKVMGVSLKGIKTSMSKIIPTAKLMFRTITAGIMSTGIGALVVAFGSFVTYLTQTKAGAEKLKVALAAVGATINVLKDRLSDVGEAISLAFSGKWREAGEKLKDSVTGIVKEVKEEVAIMTALEKRQIALIDSEVKFAEKKALTRKAIEEARFASEDETKTREERVALLQKALDLEVATNNEELRLQRERVAIADAQLETSKNLVADEKALADEKVKLIDLETKSARVKRRVLRQINTLDKKIRAEEKERNEEREAELQRIIDLEKERVNYLTGTASKLLDDFYATQLSNEQNEINAVYDKYFSIIEGLEENSATRIELEEAQEAEVAAIKQRYADIELERKKQNGELEVKWSELTAQQQVAIAGNTAGSMATILGEETAAGKAFAITQATIDTYASAQAAYKAMAGITGIGPVLGAVAAAAAIAAGMKNIAAIKSAGSGGATGGQLSAVTPAQPPAPQMMSGAFELGGGIPEPEPLRAYVVTDEMTQSQNQLANIRRRATI